MRYREIAEARKNPDKNPKVYALEVLKKYVDQDYYISFAAIDKIGINPKSPYNTPLGIYTYPLTDRIYNDMLKNGSSKAVPFAGENPFIWVLQPTTKNVLWLGNDYTRLDFRIDLEKMRQYFVDSNLLSETAFNEYVEDYKQDAYDSSYSKQMWNVTRMFAKLHLKISSQKTPVKWNWLMRNILKYDYAVDFGSGTIHEMEPEQAVFFSKKAISVVERIRNTNVFDKNPLEFDRKSIAVPSDIQSLLIKRNPTWATRFKNLDPAFYDILSKYDYIVTEQGLTWLDRGKALTKKEYIKSIENYGEDTFYVEPFNI